ncbi:MAG TPA: hypothetical protein VEA38_11270 [Terriglobales bacterium]|nr:hypothetical protein [Terriglobales bacterium]
MKGHILALLASALLGACTVETAPKNDGSKPSTTASGTALVCEKTDRRGTYMMTYTTVSGNCGELPSGLANFDTPQPNCTTKSEIWSENDCKVDDVSECTIDTGGKVEATTVSRQTIEDGSRIEGTMTFNATNTRAGNCFGTYKVTAVRQ